MKNLDILYEDNFVIIVNKPAGLAVQGGKNVKMSLDKIIAPALLVHRLDKDTSGVLLAAKTKEAAARFSCLLNGHNRSKASAIKRYLAICADSAIQGCPKEKEGVITTELEIHNKMKKAITKYKVIKSGVLQDTDYSVMEIELGTGRMHQIRRHLAMIGYPILGDDKYGDFKLNKKLRIKKLMLHAHRLIINEANIDITAPCPSYLDTIL